MIKTDLSNSISTTDRLREQAEKKFWNKLKNEPNNIKYLEKLATLTREIGKIEESINVLKQILDLDPTNKSAQNLINVLEQNPIKSYCYKIYSPAPFIYIENYLLNDQIQSIWNTIISNKSNFKDSKLQSYDKGSKLQTNIRKSLTLYEKNLHDISNWMLDKITSELPSVCPILNMKHFKPTQIEFQLTRHGDNDYFKIHRDSGDEKAIRSRALTFVYYFHKEPKYFEGGDILLFDTDIKKHDYNTRFTKLIPKNNSILFFPSNFFHQVTSIHLQKECFKNGRFAIHGWIHN